MHGIIKPVAVLIILSGIFFSCSGDHDEGKPVIISSDSVPVIRTDSVTVIKNSPVLNRQSLATTIDTKNIQPEELLKFANRLIGIPYHYTGADPSVGFDCSGFITYVFYHFNIKVPRSSVDFTDVGKEVSLADAMPGDLVLFTGTDSSIRIVGHMGIVTENSDSLRFIHATSGKIFGVTVTPLNRYYKGRFVKVTRIFNSL